MNLVAIASAAAVECERQQVGIKELCWLLNAHSLLMHGDAFNSVAQLDYLGRLVEPVKNRNGFRKTPVTFQNGGSSANPESIERALQSLVDSLDIEQSVDDIVKQFLWIHPFIDGNGRVGWLLYNWLCGTLSDPQPLPDYFGE